MSHYDSSWDHYFATAWQHLLAIKALRTTGCLQISTHNCYSYCFYGDVFNQGYHEFSWTDGILLLLLFTVCLCCETDTRTTDPITMISHTDEVSIHWSTLTPLSWVYQYNIYIGILTVGKDVITQSLFSYTWLRTAHAERLNDWLFSIYKKIILSSVENLIFFHN